MSELRPRIFIGSSKEGLDVAKEVCNQLNDIADCQIWTNAFKFGNSTFDELLSMLSLFDYGLLIATADDMTNYRKAQVITARDNVIFEFGLFTGRLGKHRTFLLTEEGAKIPTDLSGITLPFFVKRKGMALKKELKNSCDEIKRHVSLQEGTFDLGFLPSTALASGYFKNFVSNIVASLSHEKRITLEDGTLIDFKKLDFKILIPNSLSANMFKKVSAVRLSRGWHTVKLNAGGYRPFDFSVDMGKSKNGKLFLYDIPITLNSLDEAIALYSNKSHLGKNEVHKILEAREIRTFKRVLDYLVSEDPFTKNVVSTEIIDI